jgi:hypothetical protein
MSYVFCVWLWLITVIGGSTQVLSIEVESASK